MKFIKLPLRKSVIQVFLKSRRKIKSVLFNKRNGGSSETNILRWCESATFEPLENNHFEISIENPPLESYMYFPVGKGPDLSESTCFVIRKGGRSSGWGWLHKGMREDTAKAHNLTLEEATIWFGPDFISPRHRGQSLQKLLIQERLMYLKEIDSSKMRVMTLIGKSNLASFKSYSYFGFGVFSSNDVLDKNNRNL